MLWADRIARPQPVRERLGQTAHRDRARHLAVISLQTAIGRAAQAERLFEDGIEYGGKVAGRSIDDPEHLGGRGLLLQGLARLGDQPRVFHRDDRLRGEVLH